jgi:hypothetical protein
VLGATSSLAGSSGQQGAAADTSGLPAKVSHGRSPSPAAGEDNGDDGNDGSSVGEGGDVTLFSEGSSADMSDDDEHAM